MATLSERLGYAFGDPTLLERALTHRSWCAEHVGEESNERLEFLGDAVLGVIVADYTYRSFPHLGEGLLSRARASVVRSSALAEMAAEVGLGDELRLGKGEDASGGRLKPSILADSLEAVIGAVYLDGGWEPARELVLRLLADRITRLADEDAHRDYKSRLQELVAHRLDTAPTYRVSESGPEHDKEFSAEAVVDGQILGLGVGRTKKYAEQEAAREAFARLNGEPATRAPTVSQPVSETDHA